MRKFVVLMLIVPFFISCEISEKKKEQNEEICSFYKKESSFLWGKNKMFYEKNYSKLGKGKKKIFDDLTRNFIDLRIAASEQNKDKFNEIKKRVLDSYINLGNYYDMCNMYQPTEYLKEDYLDSCVLPLFEELIIEEICESKNDYNILKIQELMSEKLIYMNSKKCFDFNAIYPIAFSNNSVINQGDSIKLNVMVAAYNYTYPSEIRYWLDDTARVSDPIRVNSDQIKLSGSKGWHKVNGDIAVEVNGVKAWKSWEYSYEVK